MVNSPISDMLIQIKNAQAVRHGDLTIPFSKTKFAIATILLNAGYIAGVERIKKPSRPGLSATASAKSKVEHEYLLITLQYTDGLGAIDGIKIVSKPSRHMYVDADSIKPVRSGHGISIISTSKGIMNSHDAKKQHIGGEILCEIW